VTSRKDRTAYDVADHYDDRYYADLSARYRSRNRFARKRIENVFALLPPVDGRVLIDLGCGMGTFTIETARAGARAIGIDPAVPALEAARRVASAEGVGAAFLLADAVALPLGRDSADVVLAADLVEHLDDVTLARVLSEARRVLREGGRLVVYTPSRTHLFERLRLAGAMAEDPSHIGLRTEAELTAALAAAGFEVESSRFLPSHLPGWNLLERLFATWVPLLRRRIGLVAREVASA
jgi:SAM-dependent methyltransferase